MGWWVGEMDVFWKHWDISEVNFYKKDGGAIVYRGDWPLSGCFLKVDSMWYDDDALQQSFYCGGDSDAPGGFNVIRWCFTTIFYNFVIDDSDNNSINQFAIDDSDTSVVYV